MRKILIDCGAHLGEAVDMYFENEDRDGWEIFCIEPNPNIKPKAGVEWMRKAAFVHDGQQPFYMERKNPKKQTASMEKSKSSGKLDKKNPVMVDCLHLSRFIMESFSKGDHIVLLMDIEGTEYKVLGDLIRTGAVSYINDLYVEFHAHKMEKFPIELHIGTIERLMRVETLNLYGDFKPSVRTPEHGDVESYLEEDYLNGCK